MSDAPAPDPPAEAAPPAIPLRDWQWGIAPHYISLFLSVLFFDRLAAATLSRGGLRPTLLGLLAAGVLGFLLFYLPLGLRGVTTRLALPDLLHRTFGRSGGRFLAGPALAAAHLLAFAATVAYAADLSLRALVLLGLLGPEALSPRGPGGPFLGGPAYPLTLLFWLPTAAVLGPILVHLVAAVLSVYVVLPAVALGLTMIWAIPGLKQVPPLSPPAGGAYLAAATAVQLVLGYLAPAAAGAADWGASSRDARDVRLGGYFGVALAPVVVGTIALVTVLGAMGRLPAGLAGSEPIQYRMIWARAFRGDLGGGVTFIYTLALLGPACYAPTVGVRLLSDALPHARRWLLGLMFAALAWPLAATGFALDLETIFGLMGALVAPVLGALSADFLLSRRRLANPRRGVNPAAALAWVAGLVVGLLPYVAPLLGRPVLAQVQPAALFAFAASFATDLVLHALGFRSAETPDSPPTPPLDSRPGGPQRSSPG